MRCSRFDPGDTGLGRVGLVLALALLAGQPAGASGPADAPQAGPPLAADALPGDPGGDPAVPGLHLHGSGEPAAAGLGLALPGEIDRGRASWYGRRFHGRRTASGEPFDMYALTAAHPTLPFGTRVKVRHLESGREVEVRINDRGPHVPGRVVDLSQAAARALGLLADGGAEVALVEP